MSLDLDSALQIIRRDGEALITAAESNPDARVRACPEWNTRELAIHTTGVHRRVAHWCANRVSEPERWPNHEPADLDDPWQWCRDGLDLVIDALRNIGPDDSVWSWTDRRNGGFYHRRMLQETAVHRWDAQDAVGSTAHIDAEVAADGIDELTEVGMRFRGNGSPLEYPTGDLLLERTDGTNRWRLRAMDGTLQVARNGDAGTSADAMITGQAEDLLLYLWGRGGNVTISGDVKVAEAWAAIAP